MNVQTARTGLLHRCGLLLVAALLTPMGAAAQTTVKYIHTDALGSVVAMTGASGAVVEGHREYEPYGQQLTPAVQDGPGYTGHVQDAATGLVYMQQRYYDPQLAVFLSVDPVTAHSDPVAMFHRYRYANNNPYLFTDPDGRQGFRMGPMNADQFKGQAIEQRRTSEAKANAFYAKNSDGAVAGSGWTRSADHPYVVGREGTVVEPGPAEGTVGKFLDDKAPGFHTMGTMHDKFVDNAVSAGVPDVVANIPSMGGAYTLAVGAEIANSYVGHLNETFGTNLAKPFEHSHQQKLDDQPRKESD